ncbi:hypothetical protein P691DRAFT_177223 [Macrolepiota fuliginosa MF-IS2]|uniref:Uncharacterized protein n=1 Tax=Macrolepiota fuliginosa MF-IS2 TaxID=1400762 RepID=A0A9P5XMW6_9AGAR|nr:hypothetical protein P691DRAFT_177223 [Macrolepiota fuliginosa MF-IS2]
MDYVQDQHKHDTPHSVISSRSVFPTSPADFNILPKSDRASRRRASCPSPRSDNSLSNSLNHTELTRLRSNAFWELRRSVAENGEGFVERMRDYEYLRSRQAPDSHRKGRRRIFNPQPSMNTTYSPDSDISDDDDDDIQIFAGEVSSIQNPRPCHDSWAFSRDVFGLYQSENGHSEGSGYAPSTVPCSSPPLTYHLDSEGLSMPTDSTSPTPPSTTPSSLSSPVQSQFIDIDNNSPSTSLSSSFVGRPPSISAERAVSDLTLALANGAGSISDYTCLQNLAGFRQLDAGQPGELWH